VQHYVIKFVSDLRQVIAIGFLRVLRQILPACFITNSQILSACFIANSQLLSACFIANSQILSACFIANSQNDLSDNDADSGAGFHDDVMDCDSNTQLSPLPTSLRNDDVKESSGEGARLLDCDQINKDNLTICDKTGRENMTVCDKMGRENLTVCDM
jgi:hypothetical protein